MSEWQPIETAPMDGAECLFWQPRQTRIEVLGLSHKSSDPSGEIYTGKWDGYDWTYTCAGDGFKRDDYFGDDVRPAFWMPLPKPPKLDDKQVGIFACENEPQKPNITGEK